MLDSTTITMSQLMSLLQKTDYRTVKKWLKGRGIVPRKEGRQLVVFKWCVELALQIDMVESLRIQFPSTWHLIYDAASICEKMKGVVFNIYQPKAIVSKENTVKSTKKYFNF